MLTEFKLPGLGENIKSGVATKIMVKAGDTIVKDQPVLELETEKAVLEIPSPVSGIVKEILIKPNQEVKIGQLIMKIDTGAQGKEEISKAPVPQKEFVAALLKEEKFQKPATEEKFTAPIRPTPSAPAPLPEQPVEVRSDVSAAPSVRRFAREIGIDIHHIPGTGPGGRISIEDVKAFAKQLNTRAMQGMAAGAFSAITLPDFSRFGEIDRQPMTMIRRKTAEHLAQAWQMIPHVTQFDKADITDLDKLRKKFSPKVEKAGGKLTITSFILKVLASALKNFPQFNSTIDPVRNEIIYKKYFNIGVAVDTDRGLLVPVIRDVDKKSIFELSVELVQIAERARTKKTSIDEMQGGSFTITNLGGIGGTFFTPIVNWPEVAILGISRANLEPCYNGAVCTPSLMLPLSLSYDHRVIDGADGARFLRWVVEAIQQPFLMDLEG